MQRSWRGNLIAAFAAQGAALGVSLLTSLVVPRLLGEVEAFAYWQLFVFYSNYVSLAQLGLVDGLYLRLGGRGLEGLEAGRLHGQYRLYLAFQLLAGLLLAGWQAFQPDAGRRFVWFATAAYLVLYNASRFLGYLFLAAGHTRVFSASSLLDRGVMLGCVCLLLAGQVRDWRLFVLAVPLAMGVSLVWLAYRSRFLLAAAPQSGAARACLADIRRGLPVTAATLAGALVTGAGKLTADAGWGLEAFGQVSFALSLAAVLLAFLNQAGLVLFPALRRIDAPARRAALYARLRRGLALALLAAYGLVLPASALVRLWLPAYAQSAAWFVQLAPLCLFDGKMQLLYSTFLKALHRQKALLWLNLLAAGISVGGCLLAAWSGRLGGIVAAVVAASAVRAMLAEWYLHRRCGLPGGGWLAVELAGTAVFYLLGRLGVWAAAGVWTALYLAGLGILWTRRRKRDGSDRMQ